MCRSGYAGHGSFGGNHHPLNLFTGRNESVQWPCTASEVQFRGYGLCRVSLGTALTWLSLACEASANCVRPVGRCTLLPSESASISRQRKFGVRPWRFTPIRLPAACWIRLESREKPGGAWVILPHIRYLVASPAAAASALARPARPDCQLSLPRPEFGLRH